MSKAKKPGTPVNETLKRSIRRNMQRGIWGSKGPRRIGSYSCVGPSASMTGLDLGTVSPNGYSTMANGAWAWHVAPDVWFESWVTKPRPNQTLTEWLIDWVPEPVEVVTQALADMLNKRYAYLDWNKGDT